MNPEKNVDTLDIPLPRLTRRFVREFKNLDGLVNGTNAWTVLDAVCKELGILQSRCLFEPKTSEDGGHTGVYIKQPRSGKNRSTEHEALRRLTTETGWPLAWFGYEYDKPENVRKAVWFYPDGQPKQEKLRKLFPAGEPVSCEGDQCFVVTKSPEACKNDFDWFRSVFRHALKA